MRKNRNKGILASDAGYPHLELSVLRPQAGWYIGTEDEDGSPVSRESQYFATENAASLALESGNWLQRYTA